MTSIAFLHMGKDHCPRCGTIGDKKKESQIEYLKCPFCDTEYTNEIILKLGEKEFTLDNN
ncbi:MAG: hypothetical protein KAH93_01180 [Candidatus Aenigmarchaeota archaeon]|nr:hypothetical protein [Candidatus Aenigmarchaeota archaeon]